MKRMAKIMLCTAVLCVSAASAASAAEYDKFDFGEVTAELSTNEAGAHPDFVTSIEMAMDPAGPTDPTGLKPPYAATKDINVILPPGLLGNLGSVDTCSTVQFVTGGSGDGCSFSSQVGVASIRASLGIKYTASLFNLETSSSDEVARLGFFVATVPSIVAIHVRSESPNDYGVTAEAKGISSVGMLQVAVTTVWGVPGASVHNNQRLTPQETIDGKLESPFRSTGKVPAPFLTNPTTCGKELEVGFEADSYQEPGVFRETSDTIGPITNCPDLSFEPSFELTATNREAAAASGADAVLTIPQNEAVNGKATSQLRDTVVRLPRGVAVASGAADGLSACSAAEVRFGTREPAACPEASKIATAEIDSPALTRPVQAAVYQRTPEPGHLTRAWLVADELGVHVKLPGEFQLDPASGQITSLFLETPQVPVRAFRLHFKGGSRGVLATPRSCGTYQSQYTLTPWSGGAAAEGQAPMTFDRRCNTGGFKPDLSAGTVNPRAGAFSPFITDLQSEAGEQNLAGLSISPPPGVLAKLAGVPVCSDAAAATGSCPASSQVGTTAVATGPGPSPLWIPQPGKSPTAVYLAGPYRGGPYSLVVKTPAQAGPFDLGTVVVRAAIQVDPETARVTVVSDPLPQILEGIPITYRDVHVAIDRPEFTLNPTDCDPMQVAGTATSSEGASATLATRFQVGNCANLGFKPKLSLKLEGGTKRGGHPALRATLKMPQGGANIARAQVSLPRSEFLDQAHIRTVCTRVQFAARQCPKAAIYGRAKAVTPLLDRPLEGPVYLRSSNNPLPDLVADLRGDIHVVLVGRIDSIRGGIRTTFESPPDAPVRKFTLSMQGGKKGLLVNSTNICAKTHRAQVRFVGQNGRVADSNPALGNSCRGKK